jgi:ABC-type tungstate transport system substrate-binding protein
MVESAPQEELQITRTLPAVLTGLIVGALVSIGGEVGRYGFHFLPTFIVISGFVTAIALPANMACEKLSVWRRGNRQGEIPN